MYKGVIIEESLSNKDALKGLKIVAQEVEKVTEAHETPWLEQWTCDTVEIPEENIDDVVRDLSASIDVKHCGNWYCDFRNEDWHYVVFRERIFKINRKRREDYAEMQKYAKELGLPEHQMPNYDAMDEQALAKFLIEAKKQTYASGDEAKVKASRAGSNDYEYAREIGGEKMVYHDCYFGGVKFIGEEVVYCGDGAPKWGMNYRGETLNAELSEAAMDAVLRPALAKVGEDESILPVRGPKRFERDGYVYEFEVEGDLASFRGEEKVTKDGEVIYRLSCNGGMIE